MALTLNEFKNRLKKIKLVVTDVDGTLTDDHEKIGDWTRSLIKKIREKDVAFTIATQKIFSSVRDIAGDLEINVPFISANGRYICDLKSFILSESYIKRRYMEKALKYAMQYNARIAFCNNYEVIYTKENAIVTTLPHRLGTNYRLVENYHDYQDKIVEIMFIGFERKVIKYIQRRITFPFMWFLSANYFRISSRSGLYNLDVREARVDKCSAMKILAGYFKFKKNEVAVLGDWYNDMDLFRFGGLNIALKNAVPRLRYIADYVIDKTNNEEGVGEFLNMLFDAKDSSN